MKHYIFYREDNNFTDILNDPPVKIVTDTIATWDGHLMIGITYSDDSVSSYITLKYGDSLVTNLVKDRTPIPNIDYIQTRKPK